MRFALSSASQNCDRNTDIMAGCHCDSVPETCSEGSFLPCLDHHTTSVLVGCMLAAPSCSWKTFPLPDQGFDLSFLLILLSSRLRNPSPRKYKQVPLLHLNASALPVGWEAEINLYKFNLVKIGQQNRPWEKEMNIYVLSLTELQGSLHGHFWQRGVFLCL